MTTRSYDMYAVKRNLKNPTLGHWTLPYYPMDWQRMNKRRVWQTESSDFIHWSEPYLALGAEDGLDDLDECLYGLCQLPVGLLKTLTGEDLHAVDLQGSPGLGVESELVGAVLRRI